MKVKDYDIYRKSFPYYKVQYYDEKVMAWRDIQRRFTYPDDATEFGNGLPNPFRLMVIYRDRREIYER